MSIYLHENGTSKAIIYTWNLSLKVQGYEQVYSCLRRVYTCKHRRFVQLYDILDFDKTRSEMGVNSFF